MLLTSSNIFEVQADERGGRGSTVAPETAGRLESGGRSRGKLVRHISSQQPRHQSGRTGGRRVYPLTEQLPAPSSFHSLFLYLPRRPHSLNYLSSPHDYLLLDKRSPLHYYGECKPPSPSLASSMTCFVRCVCAATCVAGEQVLSCRLTGAVIPLTEPPSTPHHPSASVDEVLCLLRWHSHPPLTLYPPCLSTLCRETILHYTICIMQDIKLCRQ